jgi:hypothetical protein
MTVTIHAIAVDDHVDKEVQEASDRATRYRILPKHLDVSKLSIATSRPSST